MTTFGNAVGLPVIAVDGQVLMFSVNHVGGLLDWKLERSINSWYLGKIAHSISTPFDCKAERRLE